MYKTLVKRKLAYLIQSSHPSIINSPAKPQSWQRFDENHEKEIIVWIRQQGNCDKSKIVENIMDKFNISNTEADRLYYEAYPDGLNSQEEELLEYFDQILPKNDKKLVDDAFIFVIEDEPENSLSFDVNDSDVIHLFIKFVEQLCRNRKLIE